MTTATRIVTIRDNVTRTLHGLERSAPQPAPEYVAQLRADQAALAADLAGSCRDPQWRQDRIEAFDWISRELERLGLCAIGTAR